MATVVITITDTAETVEVVIDPPINVLERIPPSELTSAQRYAHAASWAIHDLAVKETGLH